MVIAIPKLFWEMKVFHGEDSITIPPYSVAREVESRLKEILPPKKLFSIYFDALKDSEGSFEQTSELWKGLGRKVIRVPDGRYIIVDPEHRPSSRITATIAVSALFCPIKAFIDYHSKTPIEVVDIKTYKNFLRGLLFHRRIFEVIGGNVEAEVGYSKLWGRVDSMKTFRLDGKRVLAILEAKSSYHESFFTKYYYAQAAIYGGILSNSLNDEFDVFVPVLVTPTGYTPTAYLTKSGLESLERYVISAVTRLQVRKPKQLCYMCNARMTCIRLYLDLLA